MNEVPNLEKPVEWTRENVAGASWYGVRKRCIQRWRDGKPKSWICPAFHVSRQWLDKWIRRFREGGKCWDALRDRSRRPHRVHRRRDAYVDMVVRARLDHPTLGAAKLKAVAGIPLSHDTIHKVLVQACLVGKGPKRGWTKVRRFQRPFPNYLWAMDITQVKAQDGVKHIATLLDDCTRFALASRIFDQDLTAGDVLAVVRDAIATWGRPLQILTDRGAQFHQAQKDTPSVFTLALRSLGVRHIMARPYHPKTNGKIERWHGTLKDWLDHRAQPADSIVMRWLLDEFLEYYNTVRPHWAIGLRVPLEPYLEGLNLNEEIARLVNEVS